MYITYIYIEREKARARERKREREREREEKNREGGIAGGVGGIRKEGAALMMLKLVCLKMLMLVCLLPPVSSSQMSLRYSLLSQSH